MKKTRELLYNLITNNIEFKYIAYAIIDKYKRSNKIMSIINIISEIDTRIIQGERNIYHLEYLIDSINDLFE